MRNGNLEPVIENCGGWNCIREWEPDPTASEADTVKDKAISLKRGVKLFGDDSISKIFRFSEGLERLGSRKNIQRYIDKCRNFELTEKDVKHVGKHYTEIDIDIIKAKASRIKNNPDKIYYQYNSGPRIVFVKDREYLFTSAGKFRTVFRLDPEDDDEFRENLINYLVELKGYK